jgi:outer membrane receptor protein involved in Fe transport
VRVLTHGAATGLALAIATVLSPPARAQAGPPGTGTVQGVVFDEGRGGAAAAGLRLEVEGGGSTVTDADGAFHLVLPAGRRQLRVVREGQVIHLAFDVTAGETAQILVHLRPGQAARVTFELPRGAAARREAARPAAATILVPVPGQVVHLIHGTPVAGARVLARGLAAEASSDAGGHFVIALPPGRHDLAVIHPRYGTARVTGVVVRPGAPPGAVARVIVRLAPVAGELPDLVVTVPRIEGSTATLLSERRQSRQVTDVIGSEQMAKAGDSDAAGALKRVTGITVVGGKYIYVRGLGERYSSTLLNGSTLPSPEPERRVVPLDMFPVELLESMVIQKTFSPDLPGEFGGGTVMLRTRGYPSTFVAQLRLSAGWVVGTTAARVLDYRGGKADWLGIDDGTRALPGAVRRASANQRLAERSMFSDRGYTAAELEALGEQMPLVFSLRRQRAWPDLGLGATVGKPFKLLGRKAGFLAALSYDSRWDSGHLDLQYTKLTDGVLERSHAYRMERHEREIVLAGILVLGVDLAPTHRIRLTSIVDRITTDLARRYQGFNTDLDAQIRVTRLQWVERMLVVQQLRGEHGFAARRGGVKLDLGWRYTFSVATRGEPDRRDYRYDLEDAERDLWLLSNRPEGNERLYSELLDLNHDASLDLRARFQVWRGLEASVKAGLGLMWKDREVDTRRYYFNDKGTRSRDEAVRAAPLEQAFAPEHVAPDGWQLEEFTRPTDNYRARHRIWSAFLSTDLPLLKRLVLTAGLRVEGSRQEVTTFALFDPDQTPEQAFLDDTDVLPAAGLTYRFGKGMVLRAYYGRTLNRPDFRELSTATFNDVTGGRQVFGNPDLRRATIDNVDLRWEWYPRRWANLSVAAFYKEFHRPIESVVIPSAQHSVTYENARGAFNTGVELTGRTTLPFLHQALRDLYVEGNLAFIWSRVRLGEDTGIQTSRNRPLQGQSPYVINLRIGYDQTDWGLSATLLYNVSGPRIMEVGALGAPDVMERPQHRLDLVVQQKLRRGFALSFKATNLIDHPVRLTQGAITVESQRRGRVFSIGVSKKW